MLSTYLLFLTFKIVGTLACAVYCWKISRLKMAPTFSYMLFCSAFILRFFTQIEAFAFTRDILGLWSNYNFWIIILNQFIEVLIIGAFLIGFSRKFHFTKASLGNLK